MAKKEAVLACICACFWLEFEKIECEGAKSAGFWPGMNKNNGKRNFVYSKHGTIRMPDPYEGDRDKVAVEASDKREIFECALCQCIKESLENPPAYSIFYLCGSWARDMWNCAKMKVLITQAAKCLCEGLRILKAIGH